MFGGMHIEKALMTCLGDLLHSAGWVGGSLVQASVTTKGKAASFEGYSYYAYKTDNRTI